MTAQESTTESADTGTDSSFLRSIEFLTGEDANLGSFLLVVGIVTCVFIALFQFTLPAPISHLLTGGVLFVTVVSALFAVLLDTLGYFQHDMTDTADVEDDGMGRAEPSRAWVPDGGTSAPLPPVINFDEEFRAYAAMYDGDLPEQFGPFLEDYRRLKTNTSNRTTVASDLRADLNPIGALFEDSTSGHELYEEIGDRLFRYLRDDVDHLTVDRVTFYDGEGNEAAVGDLDDEVGRLELDVDNEGETADIEVTVQFFDGDGAPVSSQTHPVGSISAGASRTLAADVFVPGNVESATTTVSVSDAGTAVASV